MRYLICLAAAVMFGCTSARKNVRSVTAPEINEIRFVGEFDLPNNMPYDHTVVGGLSGIDYDARRDLYYMICDDPSSKGPSRYYTARIRVSAKGIDTVEIVGVTPLLNSKGQVFPDITKDRIHSADLEAMRYDPLRDELIWSSEGQRVIRPDTMLLQDPEVAIMDRNGRFRDSFALPSNLRVQSIEKGPRHNSVFEGVALDESGKHVYVSVEDALYDDGPRAGLGKDSMAWIRILEFDRESKKQVAQYAYQIDPVPYPANPPGAFKINGVSDIMYIANKKFLVIERAYSTGRAESDIRVYVADASEAEDISGIASLEKQPPSRPVSKKLLINMEKLGRFVDNVEGVTWGPLLANGHRSLLFVVDDNFDKRQKNQFFLFEVVK